MATFTVLRMPTGITAPHAAAPKRFTAVAAARRTEESVSPVLRAKQCAGALAVAMLLATATPDAAEAARSGGRTGGSNFSRAKTEARAPAKTQPNVTNNTVVVAPPSPFGFSPFGFSPFGFSPFGFGGFGMGGMVMAPVGGLSLILDFILIGVVLSVITSVVGAFRGNGQKKRDDEW